jgi:hypothetical protein
MACPLRDAFLVRVAMNLGSRTNVIIITVLANMLGICAFLARKAEPPNGEDQG